MQAPSFKDALLWHMERHGTKVAELARATGVSIDVIKKVRTRAAASTAAENVEAIAAYYGKTVSAFMRCEDAEGDDFTALLDLLTEPEKKMLAAQIRAMVSMRGQK